MALYDAIFNKVPSKDYAIARLCLTLHKSPAEVRDMTVDDADLILQTLDLEDERKLRDSNT